MDQKTNENEGVKVLFFSSDTPKVIGGEGKRGEFRNGVAVAIIRFHVVWGRYEIT